MPLSLSLTHFGRRLTETLLNQTWADLPMAIGHMSPMMFTNWSYLNCDVYQLVLRDLVKYCFFTSFLHFYSHQLISPAEINRYVQTIKLPVSNRDLPKDIPCSVAGWGRIDKIHSTDKLFETNVTIVSRRLCHRYYHGLTDGMICAGSNTKITDSSQVM